MQKEKFLQKKDDFLGLERKKLFLSILTSVLLLLPPMIFPIKYFVFNFWTILLSVLSYSLYITAVIFRFICIKKDSSKYIKAKYWFLSLCLVVDIFFIVFANFNDISFQSVISFSVMPTIVNILIYMMFDFTIWLRSKINELFIRIPFVISIYLICAGLTIYLSKNIDWTLYLVKVGIGTLYLLLILTIANFIFFKKESYFREDVKKSLYFKLISIILIIATIFTLPVYVSWWGLEGSAFKDFITIYASTVGGLITLAGVAWTIKWTQQQNDKKRRDEIKPNFFVTKSVNVNDGYLASIFDCDKYNLILQYFKNTEKSSFTIESITINNETFICNYDKYILKNYGFDIRFFSKNAEQIEIKDVFLNIKDIDGNKIKYKLILDKSNNLQDVCFVSYID